MILKPLMPNCGEDYLQGVFISALRTTAGRDHVCWHRHIRRGKKGSKHGLLNSDGDAVVTTIPHFLLLEKNRKRGIVCTGHPLLDFDNLCLVPGTASHLCQQSWYPLLCPSVAGPSFHRIPIPPGAGEEKITSGLKISASVISSHRKRD